MKTAIDLSKTAALFEAPTQSPLRSLRTDRVRLGMGEAKPQRETLRQLTDEELFQRYTEGDQAGFRVLVERYEPRIQGFLRKRLNDEERVADLTQDTFLRIHRARESYDPARKFSTWIHTIANNLLKNEFRNRSRRRETAFSELRPDASASGAAARPVEFASGGADPSREAYRSELRKAIDVAIERMDEHHRIPFVMREVEDRTYEEIAEEIGIPVGTVKSRLNRARNSFRMLLPVPV
ncbi:MAG TPA: sigma-70 family RNA polymerase sigma factor [Longimicrobium sp.]|jgi:RNA polymerase sigma-70 factor (ECF subfamily)|uniref:RNA polymerase sigma factor n=1 Tax=Longimicrobium sp. TaxID=2029185 RepID=UPI002ED87A6A